MKKLFVFAFLAAFVALMVSGPQASAEVKVHKWHVKVIHNSDAHPDLTPPAAGLYAAGAFLVTTGLNQAAVTSADGNYSAPANPFTGPWPGTNYPTGAANDLWPCFGADNTAQPDCGEIGSAINGPTNFNNGFGSYPGAVVLGGPSYTWYLDANTATDQPYGCNGTASGDEFHFCAQANNFYEDDSGNTDADLLWSMTVKQGSDYIYDSGIQDYGQNPYGQLSPAATIVFYEDLNFGLLGGTGAVSESGPCFADYYYPVPNSPNTLGSGEFNTFYGYWGIQGTETCVAPTAGKAVVTITTELENANYTFETNSAAKPTECGVVAVDGSEGEPNLTGTLAASSGSTITWSSGGGGGFSNLVPGGSITIGTKVYKISTVNSNTSITLTASAGTITSGTAYTAWGNCYTVKYTALSPAQKVIQTFDIYLE